MKRPTVNRPALRYLNAAYLKMYDVIVLHNAHLMDHIFRDAILQYFHGKVVVVVDPFDIHGEVFVDTPTIIRSFHKLPTIIGAARHVWGVETDMLNKSAKGGVYHGKIRRNSIGALGNQMYVTDDTILIDIIRSKQTMNPIRKNQKFVITDKRIMMGLDDNNLSHHLSEGEINGMITRICTCHARGNCGGEFTNTTRQCTKYAIRCIDRTTRQLDYRIIDRGL